MHLSKLFSFISFLQSPLYSNSFQSQFFRVSTHRLGETNVEQRCAVNDSRSCINEREIETELMPSISSIDQNSWDRCLAPDGSSSPFLRHSWLYSLEESGCATIDKGWMPMHVRIRVDGEVSAFIPMYVKSHSMGEFIFDGEWAKYAQENGIEYYPKLLVGIPFSPVTGSKILVSPSLRKTLSSREDMRAFRQICAETLKKIAKSNRFSSVHMNFLTDEEAFDISGNLSRRQYKDGGDGDDDDEVGRGGLNTNDYIRKTTLQYHWVNQNIPNNGVPYLSFDDYLDIFKSKRRITIRRERRYVSEEGNTRVDAIVGRDILNYPGLVERMYEIYKSTIDKMWFGNLYLSPDFFNLLVKSDFVESLVFMVARNKDCGNTIKSEDIFAGTFNIVDNGTFYGRYWGCLPGHEVKNLHFEVCYWSAIEYCIKNGIKKMEPGAGGGDYKWARGFDPVLIHSSHYISSPAFRRMLRQYLEYDSQRNIAISDLLNEQSAVKMIKND